MRINEIFYSLQGEGFFTGTPAVFIRFAGCNLNCPFCDTNHQTYRIMTEVEIIKEVKRFPTKHIVITGGEPSLQLTESLVASLQQNGMFVAIETNGTHPIPHRINWITLSPKDVFDANKPIILKKCDELKIVFTGKAIPDYSCIDCKYRFVQPCDMGNAAQNKKIMQQCVSWLLENPQWRLSLQIHKLIGIR